MTTDDAASEMTEAVKLVNEKASVLANDQVGPGLYVLEVLAPSIAQTVAPGQFVHMRIPGMEAHILRRPFSVYEADKASGILSILYQVVGFGTRHMVTLRLGDIVESIGPIGNGWTIPVTTKRAILVGGGVGAAPLFMLAQELQHRNIETDVIIGAQTESMLVCRRRFHALCEESLQVATDDGTCGFKGFCTPLVERALTRYTYDYAAVCGPEPMMLSAIAPLADAGVATQVSLERRMACGIGACLSCVVETTSATMRDCVDGPVFDAGEVLW